MDNEEKKFDTGWMWGTLDTLEGDRGMIIDTFMHILKSENRLRKMKKFKILGFENVVEES